MGLPLRKRLLRATQSLVNMDYKEFPQIIYDPNRNLLISQARDKKTTVYYPMSQTGLSESKIKYYVKRLESAYASIESVKDGDEIYKMGIMWYRKSNKRSYDIAYPMTSRETRQTIQFYPEYWYTDAGLIMHVYKLV